MSVCRLGLVETHHDPSAPSGRARTHGTAGSLGEAADSNTSISVVGVRCPSGRVEGSVLERATIEWVVSAPSRPARGAGITHALEEGAAARASEVSPATSAPNLPNAAARRATLCVHRAGSGPSASFEPPPARARALAATASDASRVLRSSQRLAAPRADPAAVTGGAAASAALA